MRYDSGLLTDLYELTMAAGYVQTRFHATASFELFVRNLPPRRNFLVAAGLDQALDFLENMRFAPNEISYLRSHQAFGHVTDEFFDFLARFRFSGDVWALPEGTLVFPEEPLLRITAPIAEGQIVETSLLAAINFQTAIAAKAARVVAAAQGRTVIEFGSRRAHGIESGVLAARAAFIGGCQGTSNVFAGHRFGIPTYGTLAHAWIMAHASEAEAFRSFQEVFPDHAILLVDTYDVHAAVERIIASGRKPRGIRLDSGDLVADSLWCRQRLDDTGWNDVLIFASGDLDEGRITDLLRRGARIDGFGVGTALATSADAPALGGVYKLVELVRHGQVRSAAKFSQAKVTFPGRKQVFRFSGAGGRFTRDVIAHEDEAPSGGEPMLCCVMRAGKRLAPAPPLDAARERCLSSLARLPQPLHQLDPAPPYPVQYSERLQTMLEDARHRLAAGAAGPPSE